MFPKYYLPHLQQHMEQEFLKKTSTGVIKKPPPIPNNPERKPIQKLTDNIIITLI